jgi:hypothetical protein
MSPPAQKCVPAPRSNTARAARSSADSAKAAASAAIASWFTAFKISGRFRMISSTPPWRSTTTLGIVWLLLRFGL